MDDLLRGVDRRCNPSANADELERRDLDPPMVPIFEEFLTDQENAVGSLKRDLLIFSRLIFESSVCGGCRSAKSGICQCAPISSLFRRAIRERGVCSARRE